MARTHCSHVIIVSVVCPFYNEELTILDSVARMIANLNNQFGDTWELLLVNDGSHDASIATLLQLLHEKYHNQPVRVLSCPINQGRGRALKMGIDVALGNIIVTTEADCSWGDDIVLRLVQKLENQPELDFIVASPHLRAGRLKNVPLKRIILSKVGNYLIRIFFVFNVTMNTGMTRAYRKEVIQPLVVHNNDKEFHLEVLLKLLTLGFKGDEIPATITWQAGKSSLDKKQKRKSSTKIVKTIFTHLNFLAIAQPVRYFTVLSLISLIIGMGFEITAVTALFTKAFPAIYCALVGLLMLLFCLLFGSFTVLFFQFRELMREKWMGYYSSPHPPSARQSKQVFPVITENFFRKKSSLTSTDV